jgi:hypothetical protein
MAWVAGLIGIFLVVGLARRASTSTRHLVVALAATVALSVVFLSFRASP